MPDNRAVHDDRAELRAATADVMAKALMWRKQVLMPYTRAENNLRIAVDNYLDAMNDYTGTDVGRHFQ